LPAWSPENRSSTLYGSSTQQVDEQISLGPEGRIGHGVSPLLIAIVAGIIQQDTSPSLSPRTPEMTITPAMHTLFVLGDNLRFMGVKQCLEL